MFTRECSAETMQALNPVKADSRYVSGIRVIDSKTRDGSESGFRVSAAIFTSEGIDATSGKINGDFVNGLKTGRRDEMI